MAKSVRTQLEDAHQTIRDYANEVHRLKQQLAPYESRVIALTEHNSELASQLVIASDGPIPMLLWCPQCFERHIEGKLAHKPHHTHACQFCGHCWRPARVNTCGVKFLPGYKDDDDGVATGKVTP